MFTEGARKIWTADGSDVVVIGFRYLTWMAIVRLSEGGLFVWRSNSRRAARRGLKKRRNINFQ
jgi:hypothetical protein